MKLPLIIDNFAGGGGASTGIERATGRAIDVAINHDPEAVAMHIANHPTTKHYCQSILAVDPLDATSGAPVALVWFSPDCKHHSKAKGGKPREKNIRDLAWVVVHWAERLLKSTKDGSGAPQVIMLENVEEFRQWGPLDADGLPIKEHQGEEFDLWCRRLKRLGYKLSYRELRACDYGAPTSRKRLYLVARRDGLPIVWPEPTHGKPGSPEVVSGKRLPWRTAAECIDWSIPCPSIFDRKRPLKDATLRRIAHGTMRYVVNAAEPFIVPVTHSKNDARVHATTDPLRTITTAKGGEFAAVDVHLAPHVTKFRTGSVGSHARAPMPTVTANGDSARPAGAIPLGIAAASLSKLSRGNAPTSADEPIQTLEGRAKQMLVVGHLEKFAQNSRGRPADAPLDTAMAGAPRHAAVTAFLSHFYTSNTNGGQGDPLHPAKAITAEGQHHAVVCAHVEQANTGGMLGRAADQPLTTITTTGAQQRLVQTTMIEADALPPEQMGRAVEVAAFLVKYYGNEVDGHGLTAPIGTVTTKDRFAVVTVTIDATTYVIVDIGMRMLTRRELANAQGFPADYELAPLCGVARKKDGSWRKLKAPRPLSISSSIRMIGNSVCPDMSETLVRANLPALCRPLRDDAAGVAA